MPDNQVTINVTADASQAKREIDDLSQRVAAGAQRMQQSMSGILTPVPMALGGRDPTTLFEKATAAAKAHQQQVEKVDQTTKNLSESTKEVGRAAEQSSQAATRGGMNVSAMIERLAIRLVAIKLIFDAIRAAGAAITEAVNWEDFSRRVERLSGSGASAAQHLQQFQQTAQRTGQSAEAIGNIALSFQAIGESAAEAAQDADALAQAATDAGEPVDQLAKAFQQIKLGTASIDQMREFVFAIDGANSALLRQINELQQEQIQLQRNEPIWNHIYELQRRAADEQQRHADAVEQFGQHLKLGDNILQRMAAGVSTASSHLQIWQGSTQVAEVNLSAAGNAMARMLQIGNQRIMQEEGISATALKQLEQYGLIDASFVLGAYHRKAEENRRQEQQQHEDALFEARMQLSQRQLQLETQITGEFENQNSVRTEGAQADQSAAQAWKQMEQSIANLARDLPGLNTMVKDFANWVTEAVKKIDITAINKAIGDVSESFKGMVGSADQFATNINKALGYAQELAKIWKELTSGHVLGYDPGKAEQRIHRLEQAPGNILKGLGDWFRGQQAQAQAALPEQFQHGGIVHRPTLAMIGEAGPEAVVPLGGGRINPILGGAYPSSRDITAPGLPETFTRLALPNPYTVSGYGASPFAGETQQQAMQRLLQGGGAFGNVGGGRWGMLPPSGLGAPAAPAARAPTPPPATTPAPRSSTLAPTPVSAIGAGISAGKFTPGYGFMSSSISGGGGGIGGGGGFGAGGPMTTHDEGTQQLLQEMISIFRTA